MNETEAPTAGTLKRVALVPIGAGLAAIIVGVVCLVQFIAEQDKPAGPGRGPAGRSPVGIFIFMGGLLTLGIGLVIRGHADRGRALRAAIQRDLADPVLRAALRDLAPEIDRAFGHACPRCHLTAPANALFCAGCGASLSVRPCPGCGATNGDDARFCGGCGRSL